MYCKLCKVRFDGGVKLDSDIFMNADVGSESPCYPESRLLITKTSVLYIRDTVAQFLLIVFIFKDHLDFGI